MTKRTAGMNEEGSLGTLYLVTHPNAPGLFKIGQTRNLSRRLKQLQGCELICEAECWGFKRRERQLHQLFAANRVPQSEWFQLNREGVEKCIGLMETFAYSEDDPVTPELIEDFRVFYAAWAKQLLEHAKANQSPRTLLDRLTGRDPGKDRVQKAEELLKIATAEPFDFTHPRIQLDLKVRVTAVRTDNPIFMDIANGWGKFLCLYRGKAVRTME